MATDLDYYLWKENDGERDRWMWEVVTVDDDGGEENVAAGIEDSKPAAMEKIKAAIRAHR